MRDRIQAECSQEVKNALQGNIRAIQTNVAEYEKRIDELISKTDEQMKEVNDKMQSNLYDFENKKRQFFKMDGAKNVLFWIGQFTNIGSLGLLLYYIFAR